MKTPEHGKKVIALFNDDHGVTQTFMAMWLDAEKTACVCADEEYCRCVLHEVDDEWYYPAGWYEMLSQHEDYSFIPIKGKTVVLGWVDVPNVVENMNNTDFFNGVRETKRLHKWIWHDRPCSWYWEQVRYEIRIRMDKE